MAKLNICIVSWEFPPFFWAGGEGIYTAGLCDALLKLDHNVTVLTTHLTIDKVDYDELDKGMPNVVFVPTINKRPLRLLSFFLRANAIIRELGKNRNFDVVHYTNDYGGPVISRNEINRPIITTMHHPYVAERGVLSHLGYGDTTYFFTLLSKYMSARIACRRATKIIAVSRFTAEGIINGYRISPEKVTIIPDAVDTNRFNPSVSGHDLRERWKLHSDPLVVFVGRLVQNKGLNHLIKAFASVLQEIPDAKLIVVGEEGKSELVGGGIKNELVIMSKKLNLKNSIKFLGRASSEDLPKIYAAADVVVLPSIMEGFGITLLEAMATAKPCIATTVGGIPDVITNGETGILVPPGDSSALYEAICTVLKDRSLARKFGEAGCRRAEEGFTWDIVAKKTVAVYERALKQID